MTARDLGASVRQRLLNRARAQARPFQELLQYYAMERFLYRLARSPHAELFVLKGALLLIAWRAPLSRPTLDIDFAGRTRNELSHIRSVLQDVCTSDVEPDGITFDADSLDVSRIKEDADYEGARARFRATLAGARIQMQIDVGFGDVIVPEPAEIEYPTLLDFPPPILRAYPREAVVAEKLEALTALGLFNSRLKDYFDLWLLSRLYAFEGPILVAAINATFGRRGTQVDALTAGLTDSFASDPAKAMQWKAFLRRGRLSDQPHELIEVVTHLRAFASPPLSAAAAGTEFRSAWPAAGPWI